MPNPLPCEMPMWKEQALSRGAMTPNPGGTTTLYSTGMASPELRNTKALALRVGNKESQDLLKKE